MYNMSFVYCRELAPDTVRLTGYWIRGDDSKQYRYYTLGNSHPLHVCFENRETANTGLNVSGLFLYERLQKMGQISIVFLICLIF